MIIMSNNDTFLNTGDLKDLKKKENNKLKDITFNGKLMTAVESHQYYCNNITINT